MVVVNAVVVFCWRIHIHTVVRIYYESRKREVKTRPMYECRCDERLKTKSEKSTRRSYTGFLGELEHPKISLFVYYESINRGLKRRLIYDYRYDERLKTKNEESTHMCCDLFNINREIES